MAWLELAARAVLIQPVLDYYRPIAVALLLAGVTACAQPQVKTRYFRSESYTFSRAERTVIDRIANAAAAEVRKLLPGLPAQVELTVRPGTGTINEFGSTGDALSTTAVLWTVDPAHRAGVIAIAEKDLRAILFHEFHHIVRLAARQPFTAVERAVSEGMATAFERDFAGANPPWGEHPPEGSGWEEELLASSVDSPMKSTQADGRRWIVYRIGTAWIDRATAKSGRTSADLVTVPTAEVLTLAGVKQ
jgi:hypothetical protein